MNTSSPEFAHVIAMVSAAAGGFFGSASAFLLEWLRRSREEKEGRYQKLFTTQYVLITQHNSLLVVKTRYLDVFRNDPERAAKLVPIVHHPSGMRVDIGSIAFLANEGCADTLNNIYIAESCYINALSTLELRNRRISDFQNDSSVQLQNFDHATGRATVTADPRKVHGIRKLTDGLYESVDDAEAKYAALIPELRKTIKKLFPKRKAFQYLPDEKCGEQGRSG